MKVASSKIFGSLLSGLAFLAASSAFAVTETPTANTLRITLVKDADGNFETFSTDSNGKREGLTLGAVIRASGQSLLEKKYEECKKSEPITIFQEKDPQGTLVTYFVDAEGQKKRFLFKDVISAIAGTITCSDTKTKQIDIKADRFMQLLLEKDSNGVLRGNIIHADGKKELLNLGNLISSTAELAKDCKLGTEKERAIYIVFEKNPKINSNTTSIPAEANGTTQAVLIDAFGNREELNLDNLLTAVSDSFMVCDANKNKPLAAAPTQPNIKLTLEKDASGSLHTYLTNSKGKKSDLSLGELVSAAAGLSACNSTEKEYNIDISFEKDTDGKVRTFVVDQYGQKKPFTLIGNILTTAYNICSKN